MKQFEDLPTAGRFENEVPIKNENVRTVNPFAHFQISTFSK